MEESIGERGQVGLEEANLHEIKVPVEGLKKSEIYHVVKELIAHVLYIHQQIPETLQQLEDEFCRTEEAGILIDLGSSRDETQSKVAGYVSKQAIRSLISGGEGGSRSGPMKLYLLVRAPADVKIPMHFLPKRNFKCHKKTKLLRLHCRCKNQKQVSAEVPDAASCDLIWFQCRHAVKGLS